ncbi:protein TraC [Escherichia coli]|nr:type IV secretion system protein TraC [Escherichia coli]KLX25077.1 protein TraC [Escherichia coli]
MNNPLEAVTQAVNSLVTALKLPDESAKANEVLGEMSFPQFSRLLPYRDYNQESGLFMNDTTMGFMLEAIPINGANESIVEALDHMLRTKLPRGIPLCIHLMSSQLVGDRIEYGLREFSWSGEQAERFNAITRAYYMKAAATQFPLPEGMNLPLTLRHYRVFISYCSPSKKKSRADILEMENLVKIIRASFHGAKITTQTVDAQAFIEIVGEMINHNPDSLYPKRRQLDPYSDLNYQCVEDSFDLKVRADYLTLGLRENGRNSTARILNFHLARNPEIAFLWNMADNYSNLLNPEMSISCPFILTLTLVVEDQVKTHSEANLKYMDLEKKSKTSYAKWFPSVEKEAKEWGELRQRLGSGQSSVVSYFLNITAFCKDNNETALEVEQDILNSFRKNGFELISPRFNHMRNFLTCLPFMAGKGLFKQLKEAGVVQRAESFNVANLMPLVADNPLTPAGLLAPTYRNQLAFIDIFFKGMNNTNYNMAVCGTSGAGKTGLIQPLIRSVLDSGGFAVVFDMGDGYKSLCENMGGVYLDGETLRFNPFANITDIDQSAERVRDQLSVMASPNGNLDEVHEGLLLQAVRASWLAKKKQARIDDVVDFLKNARDNDQYVESPTIRSRLDEMIVLLDQYTANGTYGRYFNSDEPSLRDDAKMVVLELGGLEDRPSLLVAVMFSLIIYIENRMYRTPRTLKKLNVIDEGWRLLDFKNRKVTPPPQVTYQSVPVPNRIQRKVFTRNEGKQGPSLPYIPSGSFAKAMLIEGADANASVTGNESTVPMQLRITGLVEMPNSKTYDATGCFVGLEAWGDVSSERAIVRTRNISCLKDGKTIDMPIKGHVSFRGKNGIKGEVVMRNGKILGWAWGAGFVDGIGQGMERASQPAVGLGATAAYGAGDVLKMGIGGGASKAAQTLSDYYIKRAEQYHPVIPIGAGNEVTVVFQDGFQLKTVEEMALEQSQSTAEEGNPESPVPNPPSAESHLNGFNTDQMLKQLGNLNPQQFMSGDKNPLGGDAGKEGGNGG